MLCTRFDYATELGNEKSPRNHKNSILLARWSSFVIFGLQ